MLREMLQQYYSDVEMPGNYRHNLPETLKMIELYYHSQFKSGKFDSRGFRKFFYNINKPACDIATKFIDLDTKDITLIPTEGSNERKVWFMQKDLKQWLKEENFGVLLNEISDDYPKYGTVITKRVQDSWEKVSIANMRMNPSVNKLEDNEVVAEVHRMTKAEILKMGNWDGTELFERGKRQEYIIYEVYTREGQGWKLEILGDVFTNKKDGSYTHSSESLINTNDDDFVPPVVLFEGKAKTLPYRTLKWDDVAGRFLGQGFVEYLEDNQVAINEAENLERKGLHYTSLKLYQTRDESAGGLNVLTDAENGDILKVASGITALPMEERNLAAYNATRERWNENSERKTFSFDISRGENLPSRTPLGVANLSAGMVESYFNFKREKYGLFLKALFLEEIIPSFKKRTNKEHILTFLGDDDEIGKFDKMVLETEKQKAAAKYTMKTGFYPAPIVMEDFEIRLTEKINRQTNRFAKVAKGFYDNIKYAVDILITGESMDVGAKSGLITTTLQLLFSNPEAMQNKAIRGMTFKLLEMGGISPMNMGMDFDEQPQQPQQPQSQGGSISPTPGQPGPVANSQTI